MSFVRTLISLTTCALLLTPFAAAEEGLLLEEVEVVRDAAELQQVIQSLHDRDLVDTALVFTNQWNRVGRVSCVGYNGNGQPVGRIWLRLPPLGLRFALASDLSNDADFIGSVRCSTRGRVVGSAFLLKPFAITDLPSQHGPRLRCLNAEPIAELPNPEPLAAEAVTELPTPLPVKLRLLRIYFPVVASY